MPTPIPELSPEANAAVDTVVSEINAMVSREALTVALGTGELVIRTFYGGDVGAWRERGAKDTSFRALAARPDLEMTPTRLYYAVGIYQLSVEIGGLEQFVPPLTYSHLRSVLGLSLEEQRQLLGAARQENWTVARLGAEVDRLTGKPERPPQARAMTEVRRAFRQLAEILDDSEGLVSDLSRAGVDLEATVPLSQALQTLRGQLDALNEHLPANARFSSARPD